MRHRRIPRDRMARGVWVRANRRTAYCAGQDAWTTFERFRLRRWFFRCMECGRRQRLV